MTKISDITLPVPDPGAPPHLLAGEAGGQGVERLLHGGGLTAVQAGLGSRPAAVRLPGSGEC